MNDKSKTRIVLRFCRRVHMVDFSKKCNLLEVKETRVEIGFLCGGFWYVDDKVIKFSNFH